MYIYLPKYQTNFHTHTHTHTIPVSKNKEEFLNFIKNIKQTDNTLKAIVNKNFVILTKIIIKNSTP